MVHGYYHRYMRECLAYIADASRPLLFSKCHNLSILDLAIYPKCLMISHHGIYTSPLAFSSDPLRWIIILIGTSAPVTDNVYRNEYESADRLSSKCGE